MFYLKENKMKSIPLRTESARRAAKVNNRLLFKTTFHLFTQNDFSRSSPGLGASENVRAVSGCEQACHDF